MSIFNQLEMSAKDYNNSLDKATCIIANAIENYSILKKVDYEELDNLDKSKILLLCINYMTPLFYGKDKLTSKDKLDIFETARNQLINNDCVILKAPIKCEKYVYKILN